MRDNESKMPLMQFTLYVSPFNLMLQYSKKKRQKRLKANFTNIKKSIGKTMLIVRQDSGEGIT